MGNKQRRTHRQQAEASSRSHGLEMSVIDSDGRFDARYVNSNLSDNVRVTKTAEAMAKARNQQRDLKYYIDRSNHTKKTLDQCYYCGQTTHGGKQCILKITNPNARPFYKDEQMPTSSRQNRHARRKAEREGKELCEWLDTKTDAWGDTKKPYPPLSTMDVIRIKNENRRMAMGSDVAHLKDVVKKTDHPDKWTSRGLKPKPSKPQSDKTAPQIVPKNDDVALVGKVVENERPDTKTARGRKTKALKKLQSAQSRPSQNTYKDVGRRKEKNPKHGQHPPGGGLADPGTRPVSRLRGAARGVSRPGDPENVCKDSSSIRDDKSTDRHTRR